jgi:hypothetical protein
VNTAFCCIEELAGEMRDAFENTPESLQGSGAGAAREEAADQLENIYEPSVPDTVQHLPVVFALLPLSRRATRSERLNDGLQYAMSAIEVMQERIDTDYADEEKLTPEQKDQLAEITECIDNVQAMIDEAEGVSFPGMYG